MKSDCITRSIAVLVLLFGACTSDKNDDTTAGEGGFEEVADNIILAGQGDPMNGGGPAATSGPFSDKNDGTTAGAGEFEETAGNMILAGQGGQTNSAGSNSAGSTATSGQDAVPDASVDIATDDAAETEDNGVAEDIVVEDGQMLVPRPTGQYRVGLSERVMTPGGGPVDNADGPIAPFTPYYTRIYYPIDPAYTGERFEINCAVASLICGTPDQVLTDSYPNANMVPGTDRFPVVLFAPGAGGPIDAYVSLPEDLARHGYIVVAFQPEEAYPDFASSDPLLQPAPCAPKEEWAAYYETMVAEQSSPTQETSAFVARWVADAVHTLDLIEQLEKQDPAGILTGRLDLEKVGMFGHSIGGATAREACVTDPRFKACGNLDGTFHGEHFDSPVSRPLMIQITGDHNDGKMFTPVAGYIDVNDTTIQTVWDTTKDASAYRIVIRDIAHQIFADLNIAEQHFLLNDAPAGDAACVSLFIATLAMQCIAKEDYVQSIAGTLDPVRAINISKAYTRAFFDKHLKGLDPDLLKGPSAAYPEVTFEAKNP